VAARLARALVAAEGVERVYSAVVGHGTPHFHQHLFPRYPGTPEDVEWVEVDEWGGAPHGGAEGIAALVERLRRTLRARGD
jgi:diadenosine tetraphosphate (Ap4A) HIT family hydrolase